MSRENKNEWYVLMQPPMSRGLISTPTSSTLLPLYSTFRETDGNVQEHDYNYKQEQRSSAVEKKMDCLKTARLCACISIALALITFVIIIILS
jgi:hypothetical protein